MQLRGLGSAAIISPVRSGAMPQPANDMMHIWDNKAALVATVFAHFDRRNLTYEVYMQDVLQYMNVQQLSVIRYSFLITLNFLWK